MQYRLYIKNYPNSDKIRRLIEVDLAKSCYVPNFSNLEKFIMKIILRIDGWLCFSFHKISQIGAKFGDIIIFQK